MTAAYVGFPLEQDEAIRILGQTRFTRLRNDRTDGERPGLQLWYTDKGQYVLGVSIELGSACDLPTVDATLKTIVEARERVVRLIDEEHLDLTNLTVYAMETSSTTEQRPEIRVLIWPHN